MFLSDWSQLQMTYSSYLQTPSKKNSSFIWCPAGLSVGRQQTNISMSGKYSRIVNIWRHCACRSVDCRVWIKLALVQSKVVDNILKLSCTFIYVFHFMTSITWESFRSSVFCTRPTLIFYCRPAMAQTRSCHESFFIELIISPIPRVLHTSKDCCCSKTLKALRLWLMLASDTMAIIDSG